MMYAASKSLMFIRGDAFSQALKNSLLTVIAALFTVSWANAQEAVGDSATGKIKASMCIGCHGIQGLKASFPEVYKVPKISGQSEKYIVAALSAYKTGERAHPTMRGIAKTLTAQDMANLAAFYSVQGVDDNFTLPAAPSKTPSPQVQALLDKGGCAACHGANFASPIAPIYPKIAGQHSDYLFTALKAYKADKNPMAARSNPVMVGMAKQFTNPELKEIANYIGSLEGDLKIVPQVRFR
jgi:cytochrome c553